MEITTYIDTLVEKSRNALKEFEPFSQQQVDAIVNALFIFEGVARLQSAAPISPALELGSILK